MWTSCALHSKSNWLEIKLLADTTLASRFNLIVTYEYYLFTRGLEKNHAIALEFRSF